MVLKLVWGPCKQKVRGSIPLVGSQAGGPRELREGLLISLWRASPSLLPVRCRVWWLSSRYERSACPSTSSSGAAGAAYRRRDRRSASRGPAGGGVRRARYGAAGSG